MRRLLVIIAALITACSALAGIDEPSRRACDTNADCPRSDPELGHPFCSATHTCETVCATAADCGSPADDPSICRADHTCAKLLSEDCRTFVSEAGDTRSDDVIWFGILWPLDPPNAIFSRGKANAVELMRRDFKLAAGGLPPVHEGGPRRHMGFVQCDESTDPERAARHLAGVVRVPAILGPMFSGVLVRVATEVTIARGVLLISPGATSSFISNLANKNGLVWRTAPSDALQSVAVALALKSKIEPEVRATTLGPSEPLRVAVVHKGDSYGVGLEAEVFAKLVFNGKPAADNGASYRAIDYGDPDDPNNKPSDEKYAQAVDSLIAFAPHVVILAGTTEAITKVFTPLEGRWPASLPFKPRYLMTDGVHPRPELLATVGTSAELRRRILGTTSGTTSTLYQKFARTYAGAFQDGTEPIQRVAATYDAAYLLAYATASIGAGAINGASVRDGLKKMVPPGLRVDVGPENINDALAIVTTGGQIDFNGASGPLDFDVEAGEAESDIQVWCLGIDAAGKADAFIDSGWFYDAATRSMVGAVACP
jgi:branched-chain amino acid transport system substrate-binding protein